MPRVNMSQVDEGERKDFPILPDGIYTIRVDQCDPTQSKKLDEMWELTLAVESGPEEAPNPAYRGRRIWDNLTWNPKGTPRVKLVFKALGLDVEDDSEVDWQPEMIKGRRAKVQVTTETYEGRQRNKVPFRGWFPAESPVEGAVVGGEGRGDDVVAQGDDIPF